MIAWLLRRAASCFCLLCAASAAAGVVRTKADLRLWQTVDDRAAPLEWPWADDADSAALVFSNRLTGAVSSAAVSRGEGEMRGGCAQPCVDQAAEALFDVTLVQTDGSATVSEQTVRLKVGSAETVYVDASDAEYKALTEPRIYGWSDLWSEESSGATSATLATAVKNGASIGNWTLPATGGYGAMSVKETFGGKRGPVTAELAFDGVTSLTAELSAKGLGVYIILR